MTPVVKLADFGLSQLLAQASQEDPSDNPGAEDDLGDLSESAQSAPRKLPKLTEVCGTPDYFSPELVELAQHEKELELKESQGYSSPLDCWAVGCIIYELLSGSPPYQAKEEEVRFICTEPPCTMLPCVAVTSPDDLLAVGPLLQDY